MRKTKSRLFPTGFYKKEQHFLLCWFAVYLGKEIDRLNSEQCNNTTAEYNY